MHERASDLRSQLQAYVARDAREAEHLARMRELCESVADPFSRASFEPGHFTASAFVLSPERDALLLILHAKLGRWLQPGGHVDPGDTDLLAAARREACEEAGLEGLDAELRGPFDLDVHAIPPLRGEPAHAHFDVRFLFRSRSRAARAASDAKAARWVPLDELTAQLSDPSVMRAVHKLRRQRAF